MIFLLVHQFCIFLLTNAPCLLFLARGTAHILGYHADDRTQALSLALANVLDVSKWSNMNLAGKFTYSISLLRKEYNNIHIYTDIVNVL